MDEPSRVLVRRAKADDPAAFAALMQRYGERLRRALRRMVNDPALRRQMDSEDALQDAILAAWRGLDKFEDRGEGSFLAWFLSTARNEVLARSRRMRTEKRDVARVRDLADVADPVATDASPSEVAGGRELEARLLACLDQMPEREREVIWLRRYLEADTAEIQVEMGLPSAGAVRALLSRAQVRLAELLDGAG